MFKYFKCSLPSVIDRLTVNQYKQQSRDFNLLLRKPEVPLYQIEAWNRFKATPYHEFLCLERKQEGENGPRKFQKFDAGTLNSL